AVVPRPCLPRGIGILMAHETLEAGGRCAPERVIDVVARAVDRAELIGIDRRAQTPRGVPSLELALGWLGVFPLNYRAADAVIIGLQLSTRVGQQSADADRGA